jgi:hypothetical protein
VTNCISGSNSVCRASFLRQGAAARRPYVVDDTYWVLEAQRRKLGRVVSCPAISASHPRADDRALVAPRQPAVMWRTFQGIHDHNVGRRATLFDLTYAGLFDRLAAVHPRYADQPGPTGDRTPAVRLVKVAIAYVASAAIGAVCVRTWRLLALLVIDRIARVNLELD